MNRMFIVATHVEVLRDKKDRSKGFMTNEHFRITKNLRKRDYTDASIILDVAQGKVIKNKFNERSFEDLYLYFITHYGKLINQWLVDQQKEQNESS